MRTRSERQATVLAVVLLILMLACVFQLVVTLRQENTCWDAGYEIPVNYGGQTWCFGRDGQGVAVAIDDVGGRR